jgi:hypothetical protein
MNAEKLKKGIQIEKKINEIRSCLNNNDVLDLDKPLWPYEHGEKSGHYLSVMIVVNERKGSGCIEIPAEFIPAEFINEIRARIRTWYSEELKRLEKEFEAL